MKISELKQLIKERMRSSYQDYMDFKKYLQGLEGVTDDQKTQLLRKPDKDLDVYVNQFKQGNFKAEDVERLLKENKMKRSELKQLIKEEILKEMAVNEMAQFTLPGKSGLENLNPLGKKIKAIVNNKAYKNLDPLNKEDAKAAAKDLKTLRDTAKKNQGVKDILDKNDEDLYDNQLNKLIKLIKGEERKTRGRKKKEDDKE